MVRGAELRVRCSACRVVASGGVALRSGGWVSKNVAGGSGDEGEPRGKAADRER